MGWKWDPTQPHEAHIGVTPTSEHKSNVSVVWGDEVSETKTLDTADAEKLLHALAQQLQRLGYMM